jgi:type IV pilus assembly protein PilC
MPNFAFTARDSTGATQRGVLEADSPPAAVQELRDRGWLVLDVRAEEVTKSLAEQLAALHPRQWLPARSVDVELSLRQIAVMLRSGLTLLESLSQAVEQAQRPAMGRIWRSVAEEIQEGSSLADAMAEHARFSPMVIQLVRVGEQTGNLEPVLTRAADSLEHRRQLLTSTLTALAYPSVVVVAAMGVAAFMALNVIPKLEKFLSTIGRQLPPMTQLLLDIVHAFQAYALYGLLGLAIAIAAGVALYFWPPGRFWIDRLSLRIPLIGNLFRLAGTVAFAQSLSALLNSGITLLEGLRTIERLQRNRYLSERVSAARVAVMQGSSLGSPLGAPYAFMPMLSRMVAVGESAGTLDEVLNEVARFYEDQLQRAIKRFSVIVEPVIIIVVGGIVGFVYIAFFMALFAAGGAT